MTFTEKYLIYNNGSGELPDKAFRISASQFSQFMSYPHQWYREKILNESGFNGNTASVIGTIVHAIAAAVANKENIPQDEIEAFITTYDSVVEFPDVDVHEVRAQYKLMGETLVNQYVLPNMPTEVEPFVSYELQPGYFPSGSIDALQGTKDSKSTMIIDYKTYNSKTKPRAIPMNYKYQLLIYAYILNKMGYVVDRIRLVYINRYIDGGISEKTGKPLKSYAPEVTELTETITADDMDFIESIMNLCIETTELAIQKPELAYMLFRDYRLRL